MKLTLAAYLEETADIPLPWLREGLRRFRNEPDRVFLPAISEVRTSVARVASNKRMEYLGRGKDIGKQSKPLDVESIIAWLGRVAPQGFAQLAQVIKAKQLR